MVSRSTIARFSAVFLSKHFLRLGLAHHRFGLLAVLDLLFLHIVLVHLMHILLLLLKIVVTGLLGDGRRGLSR